MGLKRRGDGGNQDVHDQDDVGKSAVHSRAMRARRLILDGPHSSLCRPRPSLRPLLPPMGAVCCRPQVPPEPPTSRPADSVLTVLSAQPVDFDGDVNLFHFVLLRCVGKGAFGKVFTPAPVCFLRCFMYICMF
jgi:hypothetical protein